MLENFFIFKKANQRLLIFVYLKTNNKGLDTVILTNNKNFRL